jgi:hypothetical protein
MSTPGITILILLLLLTVGLALAAAWRATTAWRRFRGTRLVTCPATGDTAAVKIDARHAALTAIVQGAPAHRLADCSRWTVRSHCNEECLPQVTAGGQDGMVSAIVERRYRGKACAWCGKTITQASFLDHHAALGDESGTTIEWSEVAPETLPELFRTRHAVCWNCHVAASFWRLHPELVTGLAPDPKQRA